MTKTQLAKVSASALLAAVLLSGGGTVATTTSSQAAPTSHTVPVLAGGISPAPGNTVWE